MIFLPRDVKNHLGILKKNGVDALLLVVSRSFSGKCEDFNCNKFKKIIPYKCLSNGMAAASQAGLVKWEDDTVFLPWFKTIFNKGRSGYFGIHEIFASEQFVKDINLVSKRFALRFLSTGLGQKYHRRAYKGLMFSPNKLMEWAGVDRLHELNKMISELSPYFIFKFNEKLNLYMVRVRPEYLAVKLIGQKYSFKDIFTQLKKYGHFIKNKDILNDLLHLLNKYGQDLFDWALNQSYYAWHNIKNYGAYLNVLICDYLYC